MDAVGSKQHGSNLIGCCADSTHTHIDAYAMKDTGRSVYILFNLWVLGKVASLVKSKGSSPSEVTSH